MFHIFVLYRISKGRKQATTSLSRGVLQSIYARGELLVRQGEVHHVRPPRRVEFVATVVGAVIVGLAVRNVGKEAALQVRDLGGRRIIGLLS